MSRRMAIFAVCSFGVCLSMFYRISATVISPALTADLSLTTDQLGFVSAAFFYSFAAAQIPLGVGLDRFGARSIMTLLSAAAMLGTACFALAAEPWQAYLGRALMGLGMSCGLMGSFFLFSRWFAPGEFATLSGLIVGIGGLGQVLAASPLAMAAERLGWRGVFLFFGALQLLQTIMLWLVVRDRPPQSGVMQGVGRSIARDLKKLVSLPAYWIIGIAIFFRYGGLMTIHALWAGPFLVYGLGCGVVQAGNLVLAITVGYMLGMPLGGFLSDRILKRRRLLIAPCLMINGLFMAGMCLLDQNSPAWLLYFMFFGLGFSSAPGNVSFAHIKEIAPPELAAVSLTGVNFFSIIGSALLLQAGALFLPAEIAAMDSPHYFRPVWLWLAAAMLVCGLAYLKAPETGPDGKQ